MMKNKLVSLVVILVVVLGLISGCGSKQGGTTENKIIKVGVTAGPHAEIMEEVKKVAQKDGLEIQIVEFNDYIQPNMALNQGEIFANSYQHQPFLDQQLKDRGYSIISVGQTVIFPMGIYSKKIKTLNDVKPGAIIAIPNDPTNGGRALLLLQTNGIIKLKPEAGLKATVADIVENPKQLKIREIEAAQISRSLDDVDFAAVNTNYAMVAGLVPTKDAIALEDSSSPYANVIVARTQDKDQEAVKKLIKAYRSDEVKQFIMAHFAGSVAATW